MNRAEITTPVRHEPMRIAGRKVDADDVIEVTYPYTGDVIGTVPAGQAEAVEQAENRHHPVTDKFIQMPARFLDCGAHGSKISVEEKRHIIGQF